VRSERRIYLVLLILRSDVDESGSRALECDEGGVGVEEALGRDSKRQQVQSTGSSGQPLPKPDNPRIRN
jgi:hypothetical protein